MAKIKYFGELRSLTGRTEDEITAYDLRAVMDEIGKRYGKSAYKLAKCSIISVDGHNVLLKQGLNTALDPESLVCFYQVCAGG
jgi:molybdopterin synthase sulfur carrier subunit